MSTYVLFVDYGAEVEMQHTVRGSVHRVGRATYEDLLRFQGFRVPEARHGRWIEEGVLVPPFQDRPEDHGGLRPGTEAQLGRDYQDWYWRREVEAEREYRWLGRSIVKMPSDLFFYQVRIPTAPGHLFRPDPATDSDGTRPPIPVTRPSIPTAPGHPFR